MRKAKITAQKLLRKTSSHSINLQTRLLLSCLIIIVIPLSLLGLYSYRTLENAVMNEISHTIDQTILQTGRLISSEISKAKEISGMIYINPTIQRNLASWSKMKFSEFESFILDLRKELTYITTYRSTYDVVLYYRDVGRFPEGQAVPELQSEDIIRELPAYKKLIQNKSNFEWVITGQGIFSLNNKDSVFITLLREIKSVTTQEHLGVMAVKYNEQYLSDILKQVKLGDSGTLFIVDDSGVIVSHQNKQILMTDISDRDYSPKIKSAVAGSFTQDIGDEEYLFNFCTVDGTNWKVVGVVRTEELKGKLLNMKLAIVLIGILCFLLAILVSALISSGLTRRIQKLALAMKRVEEGDLDTSLSIGKAEDEISLLYRGFNSMQEEIKLLIMKNKETEQRKRSAELTALQHQINPHFLYNTLDSINWMAASRYKAMDISMMVTSLAKLFRLSLNKSNDITTVRNEIEHVRNYVNIQKIRFDHTFDVEYDVDPALYDHKTIKLILQPMVENSINHGFRDIDYTGLISIKVYKENEEIHFEVSDNGVGCDTVLLNKKLFDHTDTSDYEGGYGVRNVDERIRLYYGDQYGVVFHKNEDRGITVSIVIPIDIAGGGF